MSYQSPFYHPKHEYKRNIDPMRHYVNDTSFFIHRVHGLPLEEARKRINDNLRREGAFPFKDPTVSFLQRQANQDRELVQGSMYQYVMTSVKARELIAPTMTTYLHHDVKLAYPVELIEDRVSNRKVAKKKQQAAEMAGDDFTAMLFNNEQKNSKITSNSYSGATCIAGTAMYNRTTHSTLTSTTRSTSAYANANNEKMLAGNRHYFNPEIMLNNIVSIINNVDIPSFTQVLQQYGIHIPTRDEVFQYLLQRSRQYWRNKEAESRIRGYMDKFTEEELAAVLYVGDLFALNQFNAAFVKGIFDSFLNPSSEDISYTQEEATKIVETANENILLMCIVFNMSQLENKSLKDWKNEPIAIKVATDIKRAERTLAYYGNLFSALYRTNCVPTSIAYLPNSIREVALMSDTDSTIFTVQDWVYMDQGAYVLNDRSYGVYSILCFILSETTKHILALMSANFGIPEDRMYTIEMKNEFLFGVFVPTNNTKHYYAYQMVKEGNVYGKPKMEIKGVHLKSSNNPPEINEEAEKIMRYVCETVRNNELISITHVLKWVANIERKVLKSLEAGEIRYYKRGQIKDKDSYRAKPEESPYRHYLHWESIWAKRYGHPDTPPFSCVAVKTILKNKTMTQEWLNSIEDKELANNLRKWIDNSKSDVIGTFQIPSDLFLNQPLPKEIVQIVDKRSVVKTVCHSLYFILETLGIYMLNKNITRLVSDEY